jgi:hypothetical protein
VSASTVRRWLACDALKPWRHRSWIFPRDPYFAFKAARVLDLYARVGDGEAVKKNDYVLSADENQVSKHVAESVPVWLQQLADRCGWILNTHAAAHSHISPPMTSTAPT